MTVKNAEVISGNNGVIFQVDGNSIICNFVGSPVYEHIVAGTCGSAANYIAGIWFKVIEFGELKYETDFIVPDGRGNIEMLAGVPSGLSTALRFATSNNTIIVSVANATMDDNMQNVRLAGVR
ncbi:hypothetical protein FACS189427_10820 [Planctomycetales bacterium]|nr:hypothetical protein FACS189427_10820 [Planctomycetales bacterium]